MVALDSVYERCFSRSLDCRGCRLGFDILDMFRGRDADGSENARARCCLRVHIAVGGAYHRGDLSVSARARKGDFGAERMGRLGACGYRFGVPIVVA